MTLVALICGYDELRSLRDYVAGVAGHLRAERVDFAILSGGRTRPGMLHSEAQVMAEALSELCPDVPLLLEEEAMTTLDNLVAGKALAERTLGGIERWTVFCDRTHAVKVRVLSRLILGAKRRVRSIPRNVPLIIRLAEPFSVFCETMAALLPRLRRPLRAFAMWYRGVSGVRPRSIRQEAA